MVQKAALYPCRSASGEDLSGYEEWLVADDAMTCVTLIPTATPSCAHVLKTAPLKAFIFRGKLSDMMRRPRVNRTSQLIGVSSCATSAFCQYGWSIRMMAIKSGAMVLITPEMNSIHKADTQCAVIPVAMLTIAPAAREGATCTDALPAEEPWTCWKKRLLYSSMQFARALVSSIIMQRLVKTWLRQIEFGISAARPLSSR